MNLSSSLALFGVLLAQQASAQPISAAANRAEFRAAVDEYQIFVVPHCAAENVETYVAARSARDQAFVKSLRGTRLAADYKRAVAARAKQDRHTVYECTGPSPPLPLPGTEPTPTSDAVNVARRRARGLREHFDGGDRQFAELVRLRDALIGAPKGK
ncbi:hypothetical protein [uncultured Sphingomonas sp.]|uniref:hypothetical protein n=1 Tax=uncultured Sphingomonas sp. TaxID=158754 RepID=UPI0025DE30D7|nr:hypothetical protein [uncultured Sphingomonas sp.]